MTTPAFTGAYAPASNVNWTVSTSPKTQVVAASENDLIVVLAGSQLATTSIVTPTDSGSDTYALQASSVVSGTCAGYIWTARAGTLTITTTSLPQATEGTAYSATLAATGGTNTGYSWSVSSGTLPAGLSLAASTGVISGTPTAVVTASFTVKVTDSGADTASQPLSLTVQSSGGGGTWAFQTSAAEGTTYTAVGSDGNTYLYSNNAWAPTAGPQTIYVNNNNNWQVVSSQTYDTEYYVETYPNISPQFSGSGGLGTLAISDYTAISGTHAETGPGYGSSMQWEAAWQFYFNADSSGGNGWPFMIWVDVANVATGGTLTPVTIGGVNYMWSDPGGGTSGNHVLVRTTNAPSATTDLLACMTWAVENASDPPTGGTGAILSIVQFGWEIWGTGGVNETFTCSGLTMDFTT